ncbi:MAG: lytic murein transglycosylase [Mesorhizobium sp.]|uniref:Lytic murein transglycosylase n=1 Tax=Mesorhizobium mediterraneum TaxID=43617 RepID=A0AB36RGW7_9HYPH|nr:lytic murein transglycosylase [Mesorhizobium mediterraneum]RUV05205.1 lytic murein transglycosylase [Mesorhizobium sp. M6A.T.Cr.TU.017.01.1.1]RWN28352.1 MAG: lytic murein transglycosylase [Mesorhizobium sp.]RWN39386.1 MAG: lytic murein transglycosylase [Mesorhizobium sp.]RWO95598.1 MAG: lytic murein transglycosylase [Mesorhizobium sp.]
MERSTPLCPAGHLPLKGGDRLTATPHLVLQHPRLRPERCEGVISPLEGEMPGRAEGGRRR